MAVPHLALRTPEMRFILLGSHGEDLKRAFEKDWQETANYQFDDPKLSNHKGNFGVCGGYADLIIIDCDDLERWTELEIVPLIPETFTIESRPGHRQYYVTCKESFHSGGLFDPEKTAPNEQGKPEFVHIGDIKAGSKDGICGGYVVGPGCKHPSGSIYQVVVDVPIAAVSREYLQSIISKFKTSKKVNTNFQKVEEQVKAARQRCYEEKDPLDVLQVVDIMPPTGNVRRSGDELRGDHPIHGSTNGGNYVINTAKNVWHCKRCESGGGPVAAIAVKHGIISCSEAGAGEIRGDLFKRVLKIAKAEYGMAGSGNGPKEIKVGEPETLDDGCTKIKRTADNIMVRGKPIKFLVQQAQRNHVGDKDIMKHLFASIACTNSETSAGIQPELNGPKGHGKTDAVKAVFHCIPKKWKLSASISAKALYYHKLLMGTIIFSDDVQWNEDLEATVKRSMGSFQEPQTHFTLDAHRKPLPQVMPARLVWWLSSVETVSNDQLKDRQYSLDIDGTPDHSEKVSNYLRLSRSQKKIRFSVDWRIEVARAIVGRIKEHEPFKVVIPCAEFADWKIKEDHRTQNKFWDLVESFAILRYEQRYIDDDGWLHATVEDFKEASSIFMKRKGNHRTKLSDAQTRLVSRHDHNVVKHIHHQWSIGYDYYDSIRHYRADGTLVRSVIKLGIRATRSNIAKDVGISYQGVKKGLETIEANTPYIVHAPGINGELFYECSVGELEVAFEEGDIVTLPQDYQEPLNLIEPLLNLYSTSHCTSKTTINNNKYTYIKPNMVKCNKEKVECGMSEVEQNLCHSQKMGVRGSMEPIDIDSEVQSEVQPRFNGSDDNGLKVQCAVCGEDLTGHGSIMKGGKVYCTKVGCGYPSREEAKAN